MLRSMGLPITLFGERVGDRRERLRLTLAQREVDGQGPLPSSAPAAGRAATSTSTKRTQVYILMLQPPSLMPAFNLANGVWSELRHDGQRSVPEQTPLTLRR